MTIEEIEDGVECSNDTIPAEPRYNDPIFERLFAQLWEDYQTTMNTNSSLYGMYKRQILISSVLRCLLLWWYKLLSRSFLMIIYSQN